MAKIESLIAALCDADSNVRRAAAEALDELGWRPTTALPGSFYSIAKREWHKCVQIGKLAVGPLIAVLEDADSSVRQAAAQALGQIGDTRAVEPLVATLKDADSSVRRAAAEALDELGWKPTTALTGSFYFIAKREWHKCVQIGKPSVEPLIAVLKDADSSVRQAAAQTLGQIGDTRAVEPLIAVLMEGDRRIHWDIVGALRSFDTPRANAALKKFSGEGLVVCIDDSYQVVDAVRLFLEREGFRVLCAFDGTAGLKLVRLVRPDLVLLDLMMPGMDGWEVYRQMKAHHDLQHIPVIILSATHAKEFGSHLAAADSCMTKPFTGEEILAAVNGILKGRQWE